MMRKLRQLLTMAAIAALGFGPLAQAQMRRTPEQRQTLVELAYVLGEAHALHRLCAGPSDSTWYDRMERLEAAEQPDEAFRRRLVNSFNSGFMAREAQFPACGKASKAAERAAAARGKALARKLAESVPDEQP